MKCSYSCDNVMLASKAKAIDISLVRRQEISNHYCISLHAAESFQIESRLDVHFPL